MARETAGLETTEIYVWLLVGLTGIPMVIFWPWFGKKIGNDLALFLACAIMGLGILMPVILENKFGRYKIKLYLCSNKNNNLNKMGIPWIILIFGLLIMILGWSTDDERVAHVCFGISQYLFGLAGGLFMYPILM